MKALTFAVRALFQRYHLFLIEHIIIFYVPSHPLRLPVSSPLIRADICLVSTALYTISFYRNLSHLVHITSGI